MTADLRRLRRLAGEYARLSQLVGCTTQSRGQRLNGLLSEMLDAWGHRARADLNRRGNIDVAFAIDDQRFVLEAKWEQSPIGTGPIAKLQKRVRQRLGGTIGVFVSMSGYSTDAIADIKDGERLEVILLDRLHVEAMITGFCPPTELINLLLDRAHFYGDPTATLDSIVLREPQSVPRLALGSEGLPTALRHGDAGLSADWVVSRLPFGQHGLSIFTDERLLLNTPEALVILDLETGTVLCPPMPTRVTAAKALSTGDIAVVRGHGVAVVDDGQVRVLAGPFGGRVTFAAEAGDDLVVFSNDSTGAGSDNERFGAVLAVLGSGPGEEVVTELEYRPFQGFGALQLCDGSTLVLGNPPALLDATGASRQLPFPISNPFSGAHLPEDGLVLVAGGDVDLLLVEPRTGRTRLIARINMNGSIAEVVMSPRSRHTGFVFAHCQDGDQTAGAVVRFDLTNVSLNLDQDE